jgi:hypothetical protein
MRDHGGIFLKGSIPVDVIEMVMSIDDEAHRFVCYRLSAALIMSASGAN